MKREELALTAINAALKAGERILRIYDHPIKSASQTTKKQDQSPLTLADVESHDIILKTLKSTRIQILSEEETKQIPYSRRKRWKRLWLVDPLDGTVEFIERNGQFCVCIALIEDGRPTIGVIYAPVMDTLYVAVKGEGKAFKVRGARMLPEYATTLERWIEHGEPLTTSTRHTSPSDEATEEESLRVTVSASHSNALTEAFLYALETIFGVSVEKVPFGSALKFCAIAEGKAEVYPRIAPTMEWDTAAGDLIVEMAGGVVLSWDDCKPLTYNKEDLKNPPFVAWQNPQIAQQFIEEFRERQFSLEELATMPLKAQPIPTSTEEEEEETEGNI